MSAFIERSSDQTPPWPSPTGGEAALRSHRPRQFEPSGHRSHDRSRSRSASPHARAVRWIEPRSTSRERERGSASQRVEPAPRQRARSISREHTESVFTRRQLAARDGSPPPLTRTEPTAPVCQVRPDPLDLYKYPAIFDVEPPDNTEPWNQYGWRSSCFLPAKLKPRFIVGCIVHGLWANHDTVECRDIRKLRADHVAYASGRPDQKGKKRHRR